ncbi:MAG TPA: glycosyltransferase [Opitutales bacterium]|nr:glycosyltransferase [Opitutales bacterium]
MAALLREMRNLGCEIHFASVRMGAEEKTATRPLVDEWVWDFERTPPLRGLARLQASLGYRIQRALHRLHLVKDKLDDLFCEPWLEEARQLQQKRQYSRVLIAYIHYSRILEAFPNPCLRIVDTHDAYSLPRQKLPTEKSKEYLLSFTPADETRGLLRTQRIIAIQPKEAAYFQKLVGKSSKVYTVGHFAETLRQPLPSAPFLRLGYLGSRKKSLGNSDSIQWFINRVFPLIRQQLPEVELWLAGDPGSTPEVYPGVKILGPIANLMDFFEDCPVIINPALTGTGLSIKAIESLTHGRPIITTPVGVAGLEMFLGHGLFVCQSAEEFAQTAVNLLSNLPRAQQLGEESLRRAQNYLAENKQALAEVLAYPPTTAKE